MTCKDCIHQPACLDWCRGFGQEAELCEHFSDKAEWVHFPDKDCKTAYFPIGYGDNARIIEEPIVGWGIKNGNSCVIDKYGYLYEPGIDMVFLTKEEAQKELERRKKLK